ncbi:Hypothetical_protein [Hexamita inflata]|uniref:Hypothetical_protein n=1 Tax=Hexamita inflata TaxID=28002 RepID=A0ABP1IK38_9EUKA
MAYHCEKSQSNMFKYINYGQYDKNQMIIIQMNNEYVIDQTSRSGDQSRNLFNLLSNGKQPSAQINAAVKISTLRICEVEYSRAVIIRYKDRLEQPLEMWASNGSSYA